MKPYTIVFSRSAAKEMHRLDGSLRHRIKMSVDDLRNDPFPPNAKKLHGQPYHRIRVGDYRIVYQVRNNELIIIVIRVQHRKDVYRTL
jgi:mRNA interferase RelE/StbE